MKEVVRLLHEGNYSCVIDNREIRTFTQRGVRDLYDLLEREPDFLKGASVADKVIGKAAAALMVAGGVKRVYSDVISEPALTLLRQAGIGVDFVQAVPYIRNREQTGWCPLETICRETVPVEAILPLIAGFIDQRPEMK